MIFIDWFRNPAEPVCPEEIEIRVCQDPDQLPALQGAWANLLADAVRPMVFLSWDWIIRWWQRFGQDYELCLILAYHGAWLVGVLPLMVVKRKKRIFHWRVLTMVAADYGADHLDILVRRGYEHVAPEVIMNPVLSNPIDADLINLPSLDADGLCASAAKTISISWDVEQGEVCPYIGLGESWEEYCQLGLNKRMERKLSSSMRRVISDSSGTVRVWQVKNERERVLALESLFELHRQKWSERGEKSIFEDFRLRDFHHEMSQKLLRCGCLRMFVLSVGKAVVAVEYDIRCRDVNYSFQKSFSSEWSEYGPGYLLTQYAIRHSIEEGMTEFDLLRGDEPYKKYWATSERYDLNFYLPVTTWGRVVWLIRNTGQRVYQKSLNGTD